MIWFLQLINFLYYVMPREAVRNEFNSASPTSTQVLKWILLFGLHSQVQELPPRCHRLYIKRLFLMIKSFLIVPKIPLAGVNSTNNHNHKCVPSAQSSSPPVVPWQRPQKSSHTARKTSSVPVISSNNEDPVVDAVTDVADYDIGLGFVRSSAGSSPQQTKLKGKPTFIWKWRVWVGWGWTWREGQETRRYRSESWTKCSKGVWLDN